MRSRHVGTKLGTRRRLPAGEGRCDLASTANFMPLALSLSANGRCHRLFLSFNKAFAVLGRRTGLGRCVKVAEVCHALSRLMRGNRTRVVSFPNPCKCRDSVVSRRAPAVRTTSAKVLQSRRRTRRWSSQANGPTAEGHSDSRRGRGPPRSSPGLRLAHDRLRGSSSSAP
jgi:hypothetical protein